MVGTKGAAVLLVVNVLFASLLGIGAGGFTCLMLRRGWGVKTALIDAGLAAVMAMLAAYVVATVETSRGVWESRVTLILAIAVLSVIGRHILSPLHHSSLR